MGPPSTSHRQLITTNKSACGCGGGIGQRTASATAAATAFCVSCLLTRTRTCVLAPIRARPAVSGVRLDRTMPYRTWPLNQSNRYLLCSSARACCVFCALQLMPGRHTCTVDCVVHTSTDARISLYCRRWRWFSPRHKCPLWESIDQATELLIPIPSRLDSGFPGSHIA